MINIYEENFKELGNYKKEVDNLLTREEEKKVRSIISKWLLLPRGMFILYGRNKEAAAIYYKNRIILKVKGEVSYYILKDSFSSRIREMIEDRELFKNYNIVEDLEFIEEEVNKIEKTKEEPSMEEVAILSKIGDSCFLRVMYSIDDIDNTIDSRDKAFEMIKTLNMLTYFKGTDFIDIYELQRVEDFLTFKLVYKRPMFKYVEYREFKIKKKTEIGCLLKDEDVKDKIEKLEYRLLDISDKIREV